MAGMMIQIGKNGLTDGIMQNLRNSFKTHKQIKISVLKSAGHDKNNVKEIADKIVSELGNLYAYRIIGFTINLRKLKLKKAGKKSI